MSPDELQTFLRELLVAHGLNVVRHNEWLLPAGTLPALRGIWFPPTEKQRVGELSIQIALEDNRTIYENFAGPGEGSEGLDDALNAFTKGTLHVLLAALWDCVYEDQVTIEEWFWSGKHWQVFIGDFLVRGFNSEQTDYPANLFEIVEGLIKSTELNDELHWLRTFYCNIGNGNTQTEALLNNETWKAAESVISGADWQASQQFYSVRNYLMLTPKAT